MSKKRIDSEFHIRENVEIRVLNPDGSYKKLFRMNKLGELLLRKLRELVKDPIDEAGQVKAGLLNKLAAYGLRIPFVTGSWGESLQVANLVPDAGKALVASRINGAGSEAVVTYIALGTGTTAAAASDTALEAEIIDSGLERASATVSRTTTTVANDTAVLTYTWTATGSKAVTESGCFNAASAGTMLNRQVFSAINLSSGNSFQVTHNFAIS